MKKWDRVTRWRFLLKTWEQVLQVVDEVLAEDAAAGKVDREMVRVRRSIMRRMSRLRGLIKQPLPRPKKNSLPPFENGRDNPYGTGAGNG